MKLTKDESRALAFVAFLLVLSAIARYATTPAPVRANGPELDLKALEQASQAKLDAQNARTSRARTRSRGPRTAAQADTAIDPNRATVDELEALPRISRKVAEQIVAARDSGSSFETVEDLARVKGVDRRLINQIAGRLTVPRGESPQESRGSIAHSTTRPLAASGQGGPGTGVGHAVDPNSATVHDLEAVPGIGPALAKKIVDHKNKNGPFRSLDDLLAVRGIGPATLARLRPYLRLAP